MPSPRPVNPSRSVVVALTETRNVARKVGRNVGAHRSDVRCELRRLGDDRGVGIGDRIALRGRLRHHSAQQLAAVGVLPPRVVGREMVAEVAQCERAQNRIGERVQQHVRVGMTLQAAPVRNRDAADDERAPFDQCMDVEAVANTNIHLASFVFVLERDDRGGEREIRRIRDLDIRRAAKDEARARQRLDRLRLVGAPIRPVIRERRAEHAKTKHLRRLRLPEAHAVPVRSTRGPSFASVERFKVSAT
jgi:hypothetical protein